MRAKSWKTNKQRGILKNQQIEFNKIILWTYKNQRRNWATLPWTAKLIFKISLEKLLLANIKFCRKRKLGFAPRSHSTAYGCTWRMSDQHVLARHSPTIGFFYFLLHLKKNFFLVSETTAWLLVCVYAHTCACVSVSIRRRAGSI